MAACRLNFPKNLKILETHDDISNYVKCKKTNKKKEQKQHKKLKENHKKEQKKLKQMDKEKYNEEFYGIISQESFFRFMTSLISYASF